MGVISRRNGGPLFIAEGDLVTERAFAAGCEPVAILCSEKGERRLAEFAPDYERYSHLASEDLRRQVTGLGVPLEVISLFKRPEPVDATALLARFNRGVFIDNVDNPVNVGSIARNMAAMGWNALFLDDNSADPLARRALRVSMGNAFHVPHARVSDTAAFVRTAADAGIATVALTPAADAQPIGDLQLGTTKRLLVFGSERDGLGSEVLDACTHRVQIEMQPGVDSLNVAAASAIACYMLRK
jgi:tRNA G18 (ribose-2'-O)-methylase SpoU